jgi:hypothetical protein
VREIWEGIYGLGDVNDAALPNGVPPAKLPKIRPDGTVDAPSGYSLGPIAQPSGEPTAAPGKSG